MRPSDVVRLLGPARARRSPVNVEDHRRLARRALPRAVFDYLDGGASAELSLRANREQFERYRISPRMFAGAHSPNLGTTVAGRPAAAPVVLAPTGFTRLFHPDGELAAARAAAARRVPYALSTLATTSLEDVAREAPGDLWFQLYIWKDRKVTDEMLDRAKAHGYRVLVITADTPVAGHRERDTRNGLTIPPALTTRTVAEASTHPRWWLRFLRSAPLAFANVQGGDAPADPTSVMAYAAKQFDAAVTWDDMAALARRWGGPVLVKGVLSADCARRASDAGATGVIVSNHGGRQLDGTVPPLDQLSAVRDAVPDPFSVLLDSGVRRGADILKALALGAEAVAIGRPYLYALAHGGQAAVEDLLQMLHDELARDMTLAGLPDVRSIGSAMVSRTGLGTGTS